MTETPPVEAPAGTLLSTTEAPAAAAETPAAEAAPISYDDLKLPEGFTADPASMDAFKTILGEHKIPASAAQALVGLQAQLSEARATAEAQAWAKTVHGWTAQTQADPYLTGRDLAGGGFVDMKDALASAQRGIDRFGTPGFRALLNDVDLGLGNHPEVVKFLAKVGREHGEPKLVEGRSASAGNDFRAMFPNSPGMFGA